MENLETWPNNFGYNFTYNYILQPKQMDLLNNTFFKNSLRVISFTIRLL